MSTEIVIARQDAQVSPEDLAVFRRVLYTLADGLGQLHKQRWRRFWNRVVKAGEGELFSWWQKQPRSGPFHRRHMKMENVIFDAQERIVTFKQFRLWSKVGAGFVDWMAGPKGGVVPVPKSQSYDELDEDGMQELHADMVRFWRSSHASAYLWPHLRKKPGAADAMMEAILTEFGE